MKSNKSKAKWASMRYLLGGTAIASVLAVMPASAAPINLGGYTGPIVVHFSNLESFITPSGTQASSIGVNDTNYGVFEITSITKPNLAPLWTFGAPGDGYLVGTFDGIKVASSTPGGIGLITQNSGGSFAIYAGSSLPSLTSGTFLQDGQGGCGNAAGCYSTYSGLGTAILTWNLVAGADATDTSSTLQANISGNTIPFTGSATGFGDFSGGTDIGQFGTDGFPTFAGTNADISITDDILGATPGISPWQLSSNDPVYLSTAVPEPASVALFGAGLLGLGLLFRRRLKRDTNRAA